MSEADNQRLQEINTRLLSLYIRLDDIETDTTRAQSLRAEIDQLETEKAEFPDVILLSHQLEQYVTILRSAASSLQLQRQALQQFSVRKVTELTPDELRQKTICENRIKGIEKKIETYREKLAAQGFKSANIDHIILDGYREQSKRALDTTLKALESTVRDYLSEYYQKHGHLPQNFNALMQSWQTPTMRSELTYNELRILDLKADCLYKGIAPAEIESVIQNIAYWDDARKAQQLNVLKAKLTQEAGAISKDFDFETAIKQWQEAFDQEKRLTPNQASIVRLIKDLQMHGIPQRTISDIIQSFSTQNERFLDSLKRRFRRD